MVIPEPAQNLIGDNAYDSDKLDTRLRSYGIELISPHRKSRKNRTQDVRRLRRYRRRWKIERLFAWLQNFRRLVVRYERYAENFLGMLCLRLLLNSVKAYMRWLVVWLFNKPTDRSTIRQIRSLTGSDASPAFHYRSWSTVDEARLVNPL